MQQNASPTKYDYDLFVIGAGSGGVRAARIAAGYGARVAVAEEGALGGTCVNVGCVPKKLFVYGSHYGKGFADARAYGWDVDKNGVGVDWGRLVRNKNEEIERLNGIYGRMLDNAGVRLLEGRAKFLDGHRVEVRGRDGVEVVSAERVLVATGSKPFVPEFKGKEFVITSNEAFFLNELPKRIIIVGGGYVAVEFSGIFKGYGVAVTNLYRRSLFLRGFDDEARQFLADEMRAGGVNVRFNENIESISKNADGSYMAQLESGEVMQADCIMYATGRKPYTKALGLEAAGVKTGENGKIIVNDFSQTNVPSIYAIGDVTDRANLTPVAIAEGHCFADTVYGNKPRSVSYEYIPTAVFSTPTLGTCGLTEGQAREKYGDDGIDVYKTSFRPMKHTMTKRVGEKSLMKLIVEKASDKVVGCHIVDDAAGEVIQLVGVAMKAGATKTDFDNTMPVHPVSSEEIVTLRTKVPQKKESPVIPTGAPVATSS